MQPGRLAVRKPNRVVARDGTTTRITGIPGRAVAGASMSGPQTALLSSTDGVGQQTVGVPTCGSCVAQALPIFQLFTGTGCLSYFGPMGRWRTAAPAGAAGRGRSRPGSVCSATGGRVVIAATTAGQGDRLFHWRDGVRPPLTAPSGWSVSDVVELTDTGYVLANLGRVFDNVVRSGRQSGGYRPDDTVTGGWAPGSPGQLAVRDVGPARGRS